MIINQPKRIALVLTSLLMFVMSKLAWGLELNVVVSGLDDTLTKHVQGHLDVYGAQEDKELTVSRLHRYHRIAEQQIKTALQVYGYYVPTVSSELKQQDEQWMATYRVKPGLAMNISGVDVKIIGEGEQDPVLSVYLQKFPLQAGQPVDHSEYDKSRNEFLRLAIERGFLDASMVKRELLIDLKQYTAAVNLHLESGKRYYFGPVHMHQDVMDHDFINRYVKFKQGEPYSPGKLLQLQRELSDSGYYRSVEVSPDRENIQGDQVPVDVRLTPRARNEWRFGLGYATDTGARGSVNYNKIVGNEGHRFGGRALVAEKKNNFLLGYTIPLHDPVTEQLSFAIHYTDEITDSRESRISGVTTSHTDSWRAWQRVISLNYERERYIIGSESEEAKNILFPAISLSRVEADDRLRTTKGYRIYGELRGANENLWSDTNYGQLRLGLKWIRGISDKTRLLLRGDFGTTNVGDLNKLPASQRFFAGGDNSVRGYAFEELGPKNAAGEVIGGKHLLVGSVELEQQFAENWSAAVFYDAGNAINSFGDELSAGAGMGIRWQSPVGPIRFDFAWALDKDRNFMLIGID